MSSTNNLRQKASSQYPTYQPIPQTVGSSMDNPAMTRSTSSAGEISTDESLDRNAAGNLPSTYSSQQLMPQWDNDSVEDGDRLRDGTTSLSTNCAPGTMGSITRSQWFTVGVLCFVNLINYMDRFTIAGVLEDIQDDFKIGDDDGGLLQTVFVLSYMVCAPIFGYLGDRYSRRWIMAVGVLLWSTTTLLGSFMHSFGWFITFRALVGIGEASYSTIAPTIISDLFVHDLRSKMLAVFYFAIPVGSGFGYIVGSETAHLAGNWRWALRITPILGIAAVIFIWLIKDPQRGESEGSHNMSTTTYGEDVKYLMKNKSFMLSTAGFTCVAFVAGALAWWAPKFIYLGLKMQTGNENLIQNDVSYKFGMITMLAGLIGVPLGSVLAQRLRVQIENCDPYICAAGLLISAPMAYMALVLPQTSSTLCFLFIFGAQVALNLCWSIVADILLYVVVPTRRSTAEAFQILISHALGDAGSPYLCAPPAKKQKFQYKKKFYQPNRKQFLEVGHKGFLATCNFNEKDCIRECYNILNQYANDLYGPEEIDHKAVDAEKSQQSTEDAVNDDIADELQKQINLSQLITKTNRRFQVVDTGAANCIFIKTNLDDPVAIGGRIVRDIAKTKQQRTRHLLRLVPIDAVCKANDKDIVNTAGQLCDKYFLKEPTTFSIVINKRFNNDISRDQMIREIADLIHAKNTKNKVDLKHAKRSLVLEVIKGLCCLTVVDDYLAMKKYNLFELSRANQENKKIEKENNEKELETKTTENKNEVESTTLEVGDKKLEETEIKK